MRRLIAAMFILLPLQLGAAPADPLCDGPGDFNTRCVAFCGGVQASVTRGQSSLTCRCSGMRELFDREKTCTVSRPLIGFCLAPACPDNQCLVCLDVESGTLSLLPFEVE